MPIICLEGSVSASLRFQKKMHWFNNHMMFISFARGYLTTLTNLFLSPHLKSQCYAAVLLPIHTSWFDLIPQTSTPSLTPSISVIPIYHSSTTIHLPIIHPYVLFHPCLPLIHPSIYWSNQVMIWRGMMVVQKSLSSCPQSCTDFWENPVRCVDILSFYPLHQQPVWSVLDKHHLAKSKRCQVPHSQQIWDYRRTVTSVTPDSFGSDLFWRPLYTVGVKLALEVFYLFTQSATSERLLDTGG